MKKSLAIAIAAVLTFASVVPSVQANPTVQTKSTKVASDPVCCCVYIYTHGHQILHLKTNKIKARIRLA